MQVVEWEISGKAIPYWIGHDCGDEISARLRAMDADRLVVVAEPGVWEMHEASLREAGDLHVALLDAGEANKTLASVERLAERLIAEKITRRTVLVAMGGGVIGNITGLAAALLFRGIRFVHIPTTLLAMHDSVTSLKQGVNCGGTKNILGTFHSPSAIYVDLKFLETLPEAHIRAGLAELVKNALVLGGEYAESVGEAIAKLNGGANPEVWRRIVELGVAAKARLMRHDAHERGAALVLEYGHTIGHALELAYLGELNHGESVAWGMRCAAWVSQFMGLMNAEGMKKHERMVRWLGDLPRPGKWVDGAEIMSRVERDNKRGYLAVETNGGQNNWAAAMVLLREPGVVVKTGELPLTWAPAEAVRFALGELARA